MLVGRHDFTAFTPTETEHSRFERTVLRAEWLCRALHSPDGQDAPGPRGEPGVLLECWLEADTFMRHMSRVMVGTMLDVAAGQHTVEQFKRLLDGRPRADAGKTVPAHGLALASVSYR
jgi:tRNA pseudouridine38-40 synthase